MLQTAQTLANLDTSLPTKDETRRHMKLSCVRDTQEKHAELRATAQELGVEVSEVLASQGYAGLDDFYLSCPKFNLMVSPRRFEAFGADYVCFFDFIKFIGFLCLVYFMTTLFLMGTTYAPAKNVADIAAQWGSDQESMVSVWWFSPWILGRSSDKAGPIIAFWIVFVVSLILVVIYEAIQNRIEHQIDTAVTSPDDYAILVRGLPTDEVHEQEIKNFFEKYARPGCETEVVKVVIGWDMSQFKVYQQKRKEATQRLQKLLSAGVDMEDARVIHVRSELGAARDHLLSTAYGQKVYAEFEDEVEIPVLLKSSGLAVVVFRYQREHREMLNTWRSFMRTNAQMPLFNGKYPLSVERAPNPQDILWGELAAPGVRRMGRRVVAWTCFFLVLLLNVLVQYVVARVEKQIPHWWISVVLAVSTYIFNKILAAIAEIFCVYEYHDTRAKRAASLTWKLIVVMVINTVFLPLFVSEYFYTGYTDWYQASGLFHNILLLLFVEAFTPGIEMVLDIQFWFKRFVRCIGVKRKETYLRYCEPSKLNCSSEYATLVTLVTLVVFYMPLLPSAPGIAVIGLIFYYWTTKYMFIRRCMRPVISARRIISKSGLRLATTCILFALPIGHGWFLRQNYAHNATPRMVLFSCCLICLIIAACIYVMPYFYHLGCFRVFNTWRTANSMETANTSCDYYEAQHFWPEGQTYHTAQPLYRNLPETLNPRYLKNGGHTASQHFGTALANTEWEDDADDVAAWFEALAHVAPPISKLQVVVLSSGEKASVVSACDAQTAEPDPDPDAIPPHRLLQSRPFRSQASQAFYASGPLARMRPPARATVPQKASDLGPPPTFVASAPLESLRPEPANSVLRPLKVMPLRPSSPMAPGAAIRPAPSPPAASQPLPGKKKWL